MARVVFRNAEGEEFVTTEAQLVRQAEALKRRGFERVEDKKSTKSTTATEKK